MSARKCFAGMLVFFVVLALVAPVAAHQVCVPFKAIGITTSEQGPFPGPDPNQITLLVAGEGHATHMGRTTSTATVVLTFSPEMTPIWFEGDLTIVAANGDELFLSTFGVPTGPDTGEGGFAIAGGTGRFEGATGGGAFSKAAGIGVFDGEICLIRGRRR